MTGGALELRHPAGTLDGAEVRTNGLYRTGTYAPGSASRTRKAVTFRVGGLVLRTWRTGPTAPVALHLNSWFPAWLAGTPSPGAATLVDRVDVTG